jgi:hypothetical protein
MSYHFENKTLLPSAKRTDASPPPGEAVDVTMFNKARLYLNVSAQGSYTDEKLDVDIESQDPVSENWVVIASFTQVGDVTGSLGVQESILLTDLGGKIRAVATLSGTAKDYTFSVSAVLKRDF